MATDNDKPTTDDDEAAYLERLRATKRRVLAELDDQAAMLGALTPPHVQIERKRLQDELGIVESVIKSPLSPSIGDELDKRQRFIVYLERINDSEKKMLEAMDRLAEGFNKRFDEIVQGNMRWRSWGTRAFIVIIIVVSLLALAVAYLIGKMDAAGLSGLLLGR